MYNNTFLEHHGSYRIHVSIDTIGIFYYIWVYKSMSDILVLISNVWREHNYYWRKKGAAT